MPQLLPHPLVRIWVCGPVVELWFCLWETLHLATVVHKKSQPSEVLGTKPATKFGSQWLLLLPLLLSPCVYFGAQSEAALRHHRFEGKMLDRHMTCPHPALGAGSPCLGPR